MTVSPDYMAYGQEIDYDAQIIEWLKEERTNLLECLAKVEAQSEELRDLLRRAASYGGIEPQLDIEIAAALRSTGDARIGR